MEENIRLDWLEGSLAFLREILDSPEKLAWCRGFGSDVPQEFQEEVGEFLLGYRESGAEKICRDALRGLGGEGLRLSSGEDVKSASDAELESRLAGLMDGDSPFVLYGMSSGLLYDLLDELLSRRKKELREGYVCRLDGSSLDKVAALGESLRPGSGEAVRRTFALQLADPKAALFGCRREDGLIGLAHARIRTDYVEGARENEKTVKTDYSNASVSIKFFDRTMYYPGSAEDNPIYVHVTIKNKGPETLRFKLADDRMFSADFSAFTVKNTRLEQTASLVRKRT
ncbi:MAG: hypothetical protein II581_00580, partial [Oscillospiraceae bacterium]|nr:hypothetical protein [Oscillospiraceae bacterium]